MKILAEAGIIIHNVTLRMKIRKKGLKQRRKHKGNRKSHLEYSDNGPEKRVKVFAIRNGVSVLHSLTEFTSEQMHAKYTAETQEMH